MTEATNNASGPAAWLVTAGWFFRDRVFISKSQAEKSVTNRGDGSKVVPLYTAPVDQSAMVVPDVLAQCPKCPDGQNPSESYASGWNECLKYLQDLARLNPAPTPGPASPWISVGDRLPRDGQLVIASGFIFGKRENGRWVEPAIYGDDAEFHPPTQDGNGETVADFDCEMNCTTHWMPLPSAPEQPAKEQGQ